ncbi:isochorismate synthase [Ornithinibacillus xuwenensis]|uniref:Isochorismate synthase MenF n=1 Tax=Ornithinibacillus xuwenensis TaxID=3144668 RepID=A0ABU9XN95_9BACI
MIKVREETLESTLEMAVNSIESSESRLVSFTKKIDEVDALQFFEAGKHLKTNRSFWSSTIDNFTMVGLGSAYLIADEEVNLQTIHKKWNALLHNAIINNNYQTPGTGVTAMGGMAFDPLKARTPLWKKFSKSELRIPEFTLVQDREQAYITYTVMVNKVDNPSEIARYILEKEEILLSHADTTLHDIQVKAREEIQPHQWKNTVGKATQYISSGKADKIVLARELRLKLTEEANVTAVLASLMESQPTSYVFAYEQAGDCFIGATPERLVKVEESQLLSTCLAGTAPRGLNQTEDEKFGYQLLHDKKNLEEHNYVVQMIKGSIQSLCSSIQIPETPVLYKLRNLQHLYTPVHGILKDDYSIFNVIEKLHPTPALGGEPREKAVSFIRENELLDRGWYGAPIGWLDSNQNGEFAVAIRSGLLQGNEASLFAGCGVVKDSDPEEEYEETSLKFLPMLTVLGG